MNALIIAVILVIIFLLIFVMFSLDDHEEEEGFLSDESQVAVVEPEKEPEKETITALPPPSEPEVVSAPWGPSNFAVTENEQQEPASFEVPSTKTPEPELEPEPEPASLVLPVKESMPKAKAALVEKEVVAELPEEFKHFTVGSEEDLSFRTNIYEKLPMAKDVKKIDCIAVVLQFRLPSELAHSPEKFLRMLQRAEKVLEADFSFPFEAHNLNQLNRLWLFTPELDAQASDPLFESIVVASEAIIRFKNALRADTILSENKVKIALGVSMGQAFRISHGISNPTSWYGNAIYMAEALADTALDLKIYVDELIHNEVLPLFDFREWKPVALRANMSPVKMFELAGWANPDEMASYANHTDPAARRTLAVAFRYLEFLDDKMSVLLTLASDPNESVRYEALETIKVIANERTLGILKNILPETKNPELRAVILDAFGEIGSSEVMPIVLGSTKESHWRVRLSAARTLHKLCGKDSLKNLEVLLDDVDDSVRVVVYHIFYKETKSPSHLNNIIGMLSSLSKRTRFNAIKALLDIGLDNAIKAVINVFSEQDVDIQRYVLKRLEESKSKILYQCLLSLFKTSSEDIRMEIIEAIKRAGI